MLATLRPDVAAYFAEDQSTVEGQSNQILKLLSAGPWCRCLLGRLASRSGLILMSWIGFAMRLIRPAGGIIRVSLILRFGILLVGVRSLWRRRCGG
jgi:hypothetical protein